MFGNPTVGIGFPELSERSSASCPIASSDLSDGKRNATLNNSMNFGKITDVLQRIFAKNKEVSLFTYSYGAYSFLCTDGLCSNSSGSADSFKRSEPTFFNILISASECNQSITNEFFSEFIIFTLGFSETKVPKVHSFA